MDLVTRTLRRSPQFYKENNWFQTAMSNPWHQVAHGIFTVGLLLLPSDSIVLSIGLIYFFTMIPFTLAAVLLSLTSDPLDNVYQNVRKEMDEISFKFFIRYGFFDWT